MNEFEKLERKMAQKKAVEDLTILGSFIIMIILLFIGILSMVASGCSLAPKCKCPFVSAMRDRGGNNIERCLCPEKE